MGKASTPPLDVPTVRHTLKHTPWMLDTLTRPPKVCAGVYDACKRVFPDADAAEWRFLGYVLRTQHRDPKDGGLITPAPLLALLEGKRYDEKNYTGHLFLDRLQEKFSDRLDLSYTGWIYFADGDENNRCRTTHVRFPDELESEIAQAEMDAETSDAPPVYWHSGARVTVRSLREEEETYLQAVILLSQVAPEWEMQKPLLDYLARQTAQKSHLLRRRTYENLPAVEEFLSSLPHGPQATQDENESHQWLTCRLLPELQKRPLNIPSISAKTPRVSSAGYSPSQLLRAGRKILLSGPTKRSFDLSSAQLAIFARRCGADKANIILEQNHHGLLTDRNEKPVDIWGYLLDCAGLGHTLKGPVKTAMYHTVFAGVERNVRASLIDGLLESNYTDARKATDALMQTAFMKDINSASRRRKKEICREGGAQMPGWTWHGEYHEGAWVPLERSQKANGLDAWREEAKRVRQLMAMEMQSAEFAVMLAALEAFENEPVVLLNWLHDGFCLHFEDVTKMERISAKIIKAVETKCQELGYFTRLTVE